MQSGRRRASSRGPATWVQRLRLGKRYDEERLEAACKRALRARARSYRHVESILKNGLDRVATTEDATTVSLTHEGVRGRDYYH